MSESKPANAGAADPNGSGTVDDPNHASGAGNADGGAGDPAANAADPARLLDESKKFKARAIQAEKELEAIRKKQAQEQGQYKQLADEAEKKLKTLQTNLLKTNVKSAVSSIAAKFGCVDTDALLALGDRALLEIDEETAEVGGAEKFVEEARKTRPYLFNVKGKPTVNPASPGGVIEGKPGPMTTGKMVSMSDAERKPLLAAALERHNAIKR